MAYDHNRKAGNEGDIVKHVALIAALNTNICKKIELKFVDLFAGYAFSPIIKGNEWSRGIGRIHGQTMFASNLDVQLYNKWYLSRPKLEGGTYPGSSLIAHDVMAYQGNNIKLTLFDIAENPINNLKNVFGKQGHSIHHRSASIEDAEIVQSDFMFIDPPGLNSTENPEYPKLNDLIDFAAAPLNCQSLLWLPINSCPYIKSLSESSQTIDAISILSELGFDITKIVWTNKGATIGCFLAYKLDPNAKNRLRSAVEDIFYIAEWYAKNSAYIKHIDAKPSPQ